MDYDKLQADIDLVTLEWLELRKQPSAYIKEHKPISDVVGSLTEKEDIEVAILKMRSALMDNHLIEAEAWLEKVQQKIKNYGDRVLVGILKRDTPRSR